MRAESVNRQRPDSWKPRFEVNAAVPLQKRTTFKLNGKLVSVEAPPAYTLLEVLRDQLNVTGPKEDCAKGECGACTIHMDGEAICSCLVLIGQVNGKEIVTVEGLSEDEVLDPLQRAFIEAGASQCGHCIPGMIMSAKALLLRTPRPNEPEVRRAIAGNLCRCTGYTKIIQAVLRASMGIPAVRQSR